MKSFTIALVLLGLNCVGTHAQSNAATDDAIRLHTVDLIAQIIHSSESWDGFTEAELLLLADSVLSTSILESHVSSANAAVYDGMLATSEAGATMYLGVNTGDEPLNFIYATGHTLAVDGNSIKLAFRYFSDDFFIDNLIGAFTLDGASSAISVPVSFLKTPVEERVSGETYVVSSERVVLSQSAVILEGALDLEGTSGNDIFDIGVGGEGDDLSAEVTLNIDGGAGNDTFNFLGGMLNGLASGGVGDDQFNLADGAVHSVHGGGGSDTLRSVAGVNTWVIENTGGSITSGNNALIQRFDNVESLVGSDWTDTFIVGNYSADTLSIEGGSSIELNGVLEANHVSLSASDVYVNVDATVVSASETGLSTLSWSCEDKQSYGVLLSSTGNLSSDATIAQTCQNFLVSETGVNFLGGDVTASIGETSVSPGTDLGDRQIDDDTSQSGGGAVSSLSVFWMLLLFARSRIVRKFAVSRTYCVRS